MSEKPTHEELEQRIRILEQAESILKGTDKNTDERTDMMIEGDISQSLIDAALVIILVLDRTGQIISINRKGCEILEGTETDFLGKNWFDLFTPKDIIEDVKKNYRDLIEGRIEITPYAEYKVVCLSGTEKIIAWHNTMLKNKNGKIIGSFCTGTDITEKKKVEDSLRESEKRYRSIIETAMDGFQLIDMQDHILEVNNAYCKMSGYSRQELLNMKITDLEVPESAEEMARRRQTLIDRGGNLFVARHKRKDGSFFDVEISIQYQRDEERAVCFLRDVTERKKAEEALHERQELLNRSQEMASIGSFIWDMENHSIIWSPNMYAIYGYDEKTFKGDLFEISNQLIHPDDADRASKEIRESIEKTQSWDSEFRIIRPDGMVRIIRSKGVVEINDEDVQIKCFGVNQDITERRHAEERLRKSEEKLARARKMESLGLLAGGVAHDLNNVLSGIVSYPELLLLDLPEDSKFREPLNAIHESGTRAAAIVQDLLTIARGAATVKENLNLNDIIKEYMTSPEFKKLKQYHPTVTIRTELNEELMVISGSPIHIRKIIMNLVSNASEAIEGRGNVTVSTMNRYVDRPVKGYEDVKRGEYAVLRVSDDGSGILSEYLDRIFEPFFTKKVMGRSGTGLGLAVVWNIVQDHEGYIDVSSNDNGTTFEVYFPIIRDKMLEKELPLSIEDYLGNGESILIVDDEETQRKINCKMLEKLGYKAKTVSSGEEAVLYLKEHSVDIILLDMIMDPGISGSETYKRILEIHPKQKAVLVSGYSETKEVKETQNLGAGIYIKKPLSLKKLGQAIKEELSKSWLV
ncbi:MAG: PAS domain S-box protein [Deltaproteobacteria bacterium]|nr:PAS domain S-box protein [Deltaproteobacteria bacterium]